MACLLYKCDLFLHISKHKSEGMPNSILDAIQCSVPVLCNEIGFIKDLFSPKYLNFLEHISQENIEEKIKKIRKNYNKYKLKANLCFNYASSNYSEDIYKERLKNLYKEI